MIQINPRRARDVAYGVRASESLRLDMSSLDIAASPPISLRRPGIFAALCVTFGMGAAVGAYATKVIPDLALGLPVVALLIVLLGCEARPNEERL